MKPANLEFTKSLEFPGDNPVRNPAKLDNPVEQGRTMHCFSIKASDLDVNLHTNNAIYLRWIYDSYDLGFLMENDPHSVEINYLAESKYGEEIIIATTPFNENTFDHSILRNGDGKELCRLRIAWNKSSKKV
jgi:acyl-ACP thioesterase